MPMIPPSKLSELVLTRRKLFEKIMQNVATRKIQNSIQATGDRMSVTPQQFGMQVGKTMNKQAGQSKQSSSNPADAHPTSFIPLIGGAISGSVKQHPGLGQMNSAAREGAAGFGGGVRGGVVGLGGTLLANLLTRRKLGLKSNILGALAASSLGTHIASQTSRENVPLNARAIAALTAGTQKNSAVRYPIVNGKEAGAASSVLNSIRKGLGTAAKTLASDDVFYPAIGGAVGGLAGSEAYRALTKPNAPAQPRRVISPQPNKRILGNPAVNGATGGNQVLGMPVFAPKGTQVNIGLREVTEPRRSIFNDGNSEGNQFMGIPLALPQGLQFNVGPRKQASVLSVLGGLAGGGLGGLAGGAGGGILGALGGGALGGGPGAGLGLLAGGAAGLGAGAHMGGNIGASIGAGFSKKKEKPESDEKEEKSEEKSESSGDEEVKKSAAAVLAQLQKNTK